MSCALVWQPVSKKSRRAGDSKLRDILDKKFGYPKTLNSSHFEYMQALVDAEIDGAKTLVSAISKYGEITIDLEC